MKRTSGAPVSDYERQRQERIAKNEALLRNLQLDAATAGLTPRSKAKPSTTTSQKKKALPKVKTEEVVPRRTSSRLRGIVADSEVAKRKAEEEYTLFREKEREKRQRVSGELSLSDIGGATGKAWDMSGNFFRNVRGAEPGVGTFNADEVKKTSSKELANLSDKLNGLQLWSEFTPNEIKMVPERIYSMAFHPTTEKPLIFAGDKLGSIGICDASPQTSEVKVEEDDVDEDEQRMPNITTLKIHTRTIAAMQFSPFDSRNLYSASYDSSIRRTDFEKGVAVEVYAPEDETSDDPLSGVEVAYNDPNIIFFTSLAGRLGRHDVRAPSKRTGGTDHFQLSEKKIGGFSLHPAHPHVLVTASLDRTMKLWDLRKMKGEGEERLPTLLAEHESKLSVSHAAFNSAGQVATSSYDDTVKIYDFSSVGDLKPGKVLEDQFVKPATIVPHNNQTGRWVTILKPQWQLRPQDGIHRFAIGNMNRCVDIYASNGQQLAQLRDPDMITAVPAVAHLHPTMDWVAGGTASGKLCLWM